MADCLSQKTSQEKGDYKVEKIIYVKLNFIDATLDKNNYARPPAVVAREWNTFHYR